MARRCYRKTVAMFGWAREQTASAFSVALSANRNWLHGKVRSHFGIPNKSGLWQVLVDSANEHQTRIVVHFTLTNAILKRNPENLQNVFCPKSALPNASGVRTPVAVSSSEQPSFCLRNFDFWLHFLGQKAWASNAPRACLDIERLWNCEWMLHVIQKIFFYCK